VTSDVQSNDVLLHRRGEPDLRLSLAERETERAAATAVLGRALRVLAVQSPTESLSVALAEVFPWVEFLPNIDRAAFLDELSRTIVASAELDATADWLTYREPAAGANRSRRPVAPEWRCVQQAGLAGAPVGLERITAGRRAGSIRRLFPGLAGYLATFAAIVGTAGIDDTLDAVGRQLRNDEIARRVPFPERIRRRREELIQL
jgi:hypothetical protein